MTSLTPFGVVYAVTHEKEPERVRYYGQTTQGVSKRRKGHYQEAKSSSSRPILRWLRKHEEEPVRFSVVRECFSREELDRAEIELIAQGRERGHCDLNIVDGGRGMSGYVITQERRDAQSLLLRGEGTWKHVLTWKEAKEIRRRSLAGESIRDIHASYDVEESTIGQVVRNTTWHDPSYIPRDYNPYPRRLTREEVRNLRELAQGELRTASDWAREWGISVSRVIRILGNETAPDPTYDPAGVLRDEAEAHSALTWGQVREIREHRQLQEETNTVTGSRYGVPESVIKKVLNNWTFKDPDFDPERVKTPRTGSWVEKITQGTANEIRQRRKNQWERLVDLAGEYGVSTSTIRGVLDNRTYTDPDYDPGSIIRYPGRLEVQ